MNFLPGSLDLGPEGWRLTMDTGTIALNGYEFQTRIHQGQAAMLGVRPEDLSFSGSSPTLLAGVPVESCELLGADTIVWLQAGERRLAVRCAPAQAPSPGSLVNLYFDPSRASVFDATTEQRL